MMMMMMVVVVLLVVAMAMAVMVQVVFIVPALVAQLLLVPITRTGFYSSPQPLTMSWAKPSSAA
jgi:hypothetical protein